MKTEKQIRAEYVELHDLLTESYYSFHNLSKAEFDLQHGQIWANMEAELIAEGYLEPPEPIRNLTAELDDLKIELKEKGIID